ncbi:phage tail tape measure protein [Salinarimonas chemoclinalis]|uniref:phage tail tape measure protein n=1 Tax=Salinarimonas chemoclinalis TaxID=3241599 RepID=UPI0035577C52
MATLESNLVIRLMDRLTGPARGVSGAMDRLQRGAAGLNRALMLPSFGMFSGGLMAQAAALGGAYGLGRAFMGASRTAADFEQAMNKVGVVTGATFEQLQSMEAQAKELGRTTQFTASQAADAMGFLGMAGFKTDEILAAMPGTLQLAAAAQMDLGSAADIVSNVLSGYNMEVDQLGRANDVLVKAFTSANTDLSQLGEAFKYAGPTATAAGVRFEEAAAALGLMGNAGIQGSMAGTSLRGAISNILSPTAGMTRVMRRAGLNFTNAQGRLLPLVDIVRQLEPHAEDAGLFMELFGQRAGPAMAALVTQGADALHGLDRDLQNSAGTADRVAAAQMEGFNGAMRGLSSAAEGVAIAFGEMVNPSIERFMERMTEHLQSLTGFLESLAGRVTIFDRISTAYQALMVGLGDGQGGILDGLRELGGWLNEGLFGSAEAFESDAMRLAETSNLFRQIGRDFRAFGDDLLGGNFGDAFDHLNDAFAKMSGWGAVLTMYGMAAGTSLLAGAITALVTSKFFKVAAVATAIAKLIEISREAESLGDVTRMMSDLSAVELGALAVTVGLLAGNLYKLFRALRSAPPVPPGGAPPGGGPGGPPGPGGGGMAGMMRTLAGGVVRGAAAWFALKAGEYAIEEHAMPALDRALGLDQNQRFLDRRAAYDQYLAETGGGPGVFGGGVLGSLNRLWGGEEARAAQARLEARLAEIDAATAAAPGYSGRDFTLGGFGGFRPDNRAPMAGGFRGTPFDARSVSQLPSANDPEVTIANMSLSQLLQRGEQVDVNVTNPPQRPNVTVTNTNTFHIHGAEDVEAMARRIGQATAAAVEGTFSDGGL